MLRLHPTSYQSTHREVRRPIRPFSLFTVVVLLLHAAPAMGQDTIHVPDDYPTIQEAIGAATGGDEIIVAPGVYSGPIDTLGKAIHLRSTGGPQATIIHAGGAQTSIVTIASGEGPDTIVEGFTITGGSGTPMPGGFTVGGGMSVFNSSPTVINCAFTANNATYGGAIDVEDGSPTIDGCSFVANTASFAGGAVSLIGSDATVSNGAFAGNTAVLGGAIYHGFGDNSTVTGGAFKDNHASAKGGAIHIEDGAPTVEESTFTENTAHRGGGISVFGTKPSIIGCHFSGNFGQHAGGGIYNEGAGPLISHCTFDGNSSSPPQPQPFNQTVGGGGAIHNAWSSTPVIEHSHFVNNFTEWDGGAIANLNHSHVTLSGCTFGDNVSTRNGRYIVAYQGAETIIENCVFDGSDHSGTGSSFIISGWHASNTTIIGSTFTNFTATSQIVVWLQFDSEIHIAASTFEENSAMLIGNMSEAAVTTISGSTFANNTASYGPALVWHPPAALPLQLSDTLFCGTDGEDIWGAWDDLGGNEFLETCPWDELEDAIPGDLNGDGVVDGADLLILLGNFGECDDPDDCPADLNGDGVVNGADLLLLLTNWG